MLTVDAGRLRNVCTIERNTGTTPDGYGQIRPNWTVLYANVPCEVKPLSSRERWSAEQVKAETTHRIYCRYAPGITSDCRVVFENRIFTISGVIDLEERHQLLELLCVE